MVVVALKFRYCCYFLLNGELPWRCRRIMSLTVKPSQAKKLASGHLFSRGISPLSPSSLVSCMVPLQSALQVTSMMKIVFKKEMFFYVIHVSLCCGLMGSCMFITDGRQPGIQDRPFLN